MVSSSIKASGIEEIVGFTESLDLQIIAPDVLALDETINVTGASPTTHAADDVKAHQFKVWFGN